RVVGHPSPGCAAADLPSLRRPRRHAEVGAAFLGIERLVAGADQHVAVRSGAVGAPDLLPLLRIEGDEPAAHAVFAAAVADQDAILHHQRRHGARLADADVAGAIAPDFLPARGVEPDRLVVERVQEDLAIRVREAAVDDVAAGDALGEGLRLRL